MDQNEDFNADQLFNDDSLQQIDAAVSLDALGGVSLPSNPLVIERILKLQACGAINQVAWSRGGGGHIARIAEDGVTVDIHCLLFDSKTLSWKLSPKQTESPDLGELSSLAWSPTGSDLAIVDSTGRLCIIRPQPGTSNRFLQVRSGRTDDTDELSQVVGLHWLSQDTSSPERPKTAVQYASKVDSKWAQHMARAVSYGPRSQRAITIVDRKARLSLIYMKPDTSFVKVTTQLVDEDNTLFTHAAFSPTLEGKLLVALHSYDGVISSYLVKIDFPEPGQGPDVQAKLSVELASAHLPSTNVDGLVNGQQYDPDSLALTHLSIIPTSEIEKTDHGPPTVVGIYSNTNKRLGSTDPGFLISSFIRRWTISAIQQSLHSRFDELPTKATDTTPSSGFAAHQLPDKEEQVLTSACLVDNGQVLAIATQDGRTDFLTAEDMSSVSYQASATEASSLPQSGFIFPLLTTPSCLSSSPNSCVVALTTPTQTLELATMDFPSGFDNPSSPAVDAALAAIIITLSRAIWATANIDDLLSVIQHAFPPTLLVPLTTHLYRTLFKDSEFINDRITGSHLDQVVQKPVLMKVLSFHYMISFLSLKTTQTFGTPSQNTQLALSGQWAWLAANLRFVAYLLMIVTKEINNPKESLSQEFVEIICANIKWALDLMRYMVSKILEVEDRESNPDFFPPPAEGEAVDGSQGLVALLLNCHWSRRLLVTTVNAMKMLFKAQEPRSKQQMQILRAIAEGSHGKGVGLPAIDSLLNAGWSEPGDVGDFREMAARQVEMMATGVVSGGYQGTVKRLLGRAFGVDGQLRRAGASQKGGVDRLKAWGDEIDLGWLMLEDRGGKAKGRGKVYDVHRKKIITKGVREAETNGLMIKRCVRCGRLSEDVNGMGAAIPRIVAGMMMRCVCDGSWIVEAWDK